MNLVKSLTQCEDSPKQVSYDSQSFIKILENRRDDTNKRLDELNDAINALKEHPEILTVLEKIAKIR